MGKKGCHKTNTLHFICLCRCILGEPSICILRQLLLLPARVFFQIFSDSQTVVAKIAVCMDSVILRESCIIFTQLPGILFNEDTKPLALSQIRKLISYLDIPR